MSKKLPNSFYQNPEVIEVAKNLLGKHLFTNIDNQLTGGIIVEVEAYSGATDKASHAFMNKITNRTIIMFEAGGIAYVYLCYGIHYLFNVVTNVKGLADAVLIRALEPLCGQKIMQNRRGTMAANAQLTSGPGKLAKALGITSQLNAASLLSKTVWIEEGYETNFDIESSKRIGVDYAEEDALLPWRFLIKGNPWISKN